MRNPFATVSEAARLALLVRRQFPGAPTPADVQVFADNYFAAMHKMMPRADWQLYTTQSDYAKTRDAVRHQALCRWADFGLPNFSVTTGLAASLVLTKYPNLTIGEVPWPFETFCVQLPRPWLPAPFADLSMIWFSRYLTGSGTAISIESVFGNADAGFLHRVTPPGASVESFIESRLLSEGSIAVSDEEWSIMRLCCRVIVGLSIYLQTLEGRMTSSVSNRRVVRGKVAASPAKPPTEPPPADEVFRPLGGGIPTVWTVGATIKLPRELRDVACDFSRSQLEKHRAGWRLQRRYLVRGHAQRYVVGRRVEGVREWRMKAPFWKGPKEGVGLIRKYDVRAPTR